MAQVFAALLGLEKLRLRDHPITVTACRVTQAQNEAFRPSDARTYARLNRAVARLPTCTTLPSAMSPRRLAVSFVTVAPALGAAHTFANSCFFVSRPRPIALSTAALRVPVNLRLPALIPMDSEGT